MKKKWFNDERVYRPLFKWIRVMKLTLFFLLAALMHVSASVYSQQTKLSISMRDVTVKEVLKQIEDQSEFFFLYKNIDIDVNRIVSVDIKEKSVENLLDQIFNGTTVAYEVVNRQIVLTDKTKENPLPASQQQKKTISGKVTDSTGASLPGVSVAVKGTTIGVITDNNGKYNLSSIPENAILQFSFVGMKTQEIKIGTQSSINIVLAEETVGIEEVVAVGYGTSSKKKLTTSISSVKMEDIDRGSTYDPVKSLQGRTSGVNVVSNSGIPGSNPTILIRGIGSISGGGSPLYVVDGLPTDNLPNINPNDIETMDVLKDASAAAIYGSRANNGVIIIKTKSGKSGKTVIEMNSRFGIGKLKNDIQMANSTEYADVMQAAVNNYNKQKGTALTFYQPSTIEETNWVKEIARNSSGTSEHNINISGGNDKTTFFTSIGYFNQEGYLQRSNFEQYSFRINLAHQINSIFKINVNLGSTYSNQLLLEETSTSLKILRTAREEQPWYSPYDASGNYKVNGTKILRHNPVMLLNEETWTRKNLQGVGTVSLDITPIKGLKYTPSISAYGILTDERKKLTENMVARSTSAGWGALLQDRNESLRYVIDNIISYSNSFRKINYSALVGHEYWYRTYDNLGAYSDNYKNNAYPSSSFDILTAGTNIYADNIGYSAYNMESFFGRISSDYNNRYFINFSLRRDGCSKFSKDSRYGTFPSLSAAWRISNERFFPKQDVLTDLKLRLSWGLTGSIDGIGNYASLALVNGGNGYNGSSGLILGQDAQNLTWEKARQSNAGIDAEFLKGRINFTADYFYQKTENLLFNLPVYATTGYTSIAANIGTLENKGLELGMNARILTGEFKWNVGGNISFVNNKLLSLYKDASMYVVPGELSNLLGGSMHALINGEAISSYYMYNMLGIYQKDGEVPAKLFTKGVRAGDVKYEDLNSDGDISDVDRKLVGKAIPDFYGGFNTSLLWKGFELSLFGQFSYGGKILAAWQGTNSVEGTDNPAMSPSSVKLDDGTKVEQYFNVRSYVAQNYWHGEGTSNLVPRPVRTGVFSGYSYGYNNLTSTRYLEDASFIRLKTLTIGYNLPQRLISKAKIVGLRFFISLDNIATFTKYSGYDPESSYAGSPGNSNYGVDFGLEPALRTFSAGINIKL